MQDEVRKFAFAEIERATAELEAPRESREHSISYWLGVLATAHKLLALKPADEV